MFARTQRGLPLAPFRQAFTLVELLVAMTIFAILATLALSAFRETDQDRAAAGSQQLRSMLEGARSRAIHDGQLRGVRLLLDGNNLQTVTSLVYIGAPRLYEGTIHSTPGMGVLAWIEGDASNPPNWTLTDTTGTWLNLVNRRLVLYENPVGSGTWYGLPGVRIEIPANSGRWFRVIRGTVNVGANTVTLQLAGHIVPSAPNVGGDYEAQPAATDFAYRLELAPPILAGSTPKLLANGVAIDLAGSNVPGVWVDDNGTTTGADYWSDDIFSTRMDILFTPRGDVAGAVAAYGVLNFAVADVADINNNVRYGTPAMNYSDDLRHPALQVEKPDRLVTLFPRTGLVTTSQVNHFDNTLSPYALALLGQDAP